jgi:hypothetical protein
VVHGQPHPTLLTDAQCPAAFGDGGRQWLLAQDPRHAGIRRLAGHAGMRSRRGGDAEDVDRLFREKALPVAVSTSRGHQCGRLGERALPEIGDGDNVGTDRLQRLDVAPAHAAHADDARPRR